MKHQALFLLKDKTEKSIVSSAAILLGTLRVNVWLQQSFLSCLLPRQARRKYYFFTGGGRGMNECLSSFLIFALFCDSLQIRETLPLLNSCLKEKSLLFIRAVFFWKGFLVQRKIVVIWKFGGKNIVGVNMHVYGLFYFQNLTD